MIAITDVVILAAGAFQFRETEVDALEDDPATIRAETLVEVRSLLSSKFKAKHDVIEWIDEQLS